MGFDIAAHLCFDACVCSVFVFIGCHLIKEWVPNEADMPTEVINLLSSSPTRPEATSVAVPSLESAERGDTRVPCRPIRYDLQHPTNAETRSNATGLSSYTSTEPTVSTKRSSSDQTHHDEDESLFLSDDCDTIHNPDTGLPKKRGTSVGLSRGTRRRDGPVSPQKTTSSLVGSSNQVPLRPFGTKRWNNVLEDIEFSSSPVDLASSKAAGKAPVILSDPFASPQEDHMSKQASYGTTSNASPSGLPHRPDQDGGGASRSRPAGARSNYDAQRPARTTFIDLSSDPTDSPPSPPKPQLDISNGRGQATWDPISSSAPNTYDIEDLLSSPHATAVGATIIDSSSDSDGLPDLDAVDFSKVRATKHSRRTSSHPTIQTSRQATKKVGRTNEEKEREKKDRAEAREIDKERKRIEKVRAREARALQKEEEKALAEVNKLRTDKKVSAPEMIVDIPTSISPGLKVQLEALLGDLNVQHETWDSTVEHVVKWRRKVASRFDEEMGLWKPMPMRIQDENHVLVIVQADQFVKFVLGGEGHDLDAHVLQMKGKFPGTKIIYLIESLTAWMRKNKNLLNRQFASAVRNLGADSEPSIQSHRRGNNHPQEYMDEDKIEDALLSLQVLHGALVHHTNAPVETAQWVAVFTQHISTIPYRKARDASADAGFCMESGQVRTGDSAKDTYIRMLQEIARVTAPVAYGIVAKYETVTDLIRGLEEEGPLALAACRKSANKDGALTDRTIGQAISKRIHKIFLGQDPLSTDV